MRNTISSVQLLALLACLLLRANAEYYPVDVINSRHYEGKYNATQQGVLHYSHSKLSTIWTARRAE